MMVTMEELITDIDNTEKEVRAYALLEEGYTILSTLPENAGSMAFSYHTKSKCYGNSKVECDAFLQKLKKLKEGDK